MFGLDYVTGPPIADLKAAGVTFVCRYLSFENDQTRVKILNPVEAKTLSDAGIAIVSLYEWYANRPLEGFASGVQDAHIAQSQHTACGGPVDRPLYFAVDIDVDGSQVVEYFRGAASIIGLHRVGVYGSYRVTKYLFDNNLITWGWQTYAWSDGAWEPRAHIQQYQNGMNIAGHSVDFDRSIKSDFGQWLEGNKMTIPSGWKDNNSILTAPNGVSVRAGFRDHVLSNNWNADNWPLQAEEASNPLEISNPSLGNGTWQPFRWTVLEWNTTRNVFEMWTGQELLTTRKQVVSLQQQLATANAQIATLQQQLDANAQAQKIKELEDCLAQIEKIASLS